MDYRKFDEWSRAGYKIIKGSKATWIDDVPMFSENQVVRTQPRDYLTYDDDYATPVWVVDTDLDTLVQQKMMAFGGGRMSDLDLFIEGGIDAANDEEDHWLNVRPY